MKRALLLLSGLLILNSGDAQVRGSQKLSDIFQGSANTDTSISNILRLNALANCNGSAHKTTSTQERLTGISSFDSRPATTDSVVLLYSEGRGSQFDFMDMSYYDGLIPYPIRVGDSHVDYDSVRDIIAAGAIINRRFYSASGKPVKNEEPSVHTFYQYDGSGLLSRATEVQYNNTTGYGDSLRRRIFRYDVAGLLLLDSTEIRTQTSWERYNKFEYAYDASGRRIHADASQAGSMGTYDVVADIQYDYAGSSTLPSRFIIRTRNGSTAPLEQNSKDSFEYSSNMMVLHDIYRWNSTTSAWDPQSTERRHLNASNLPDSIATHYFITGSAYDSTYSKFEYNTQGNPTLEANYAFGNPVPTGGTRYQYGPVETVGIGKLQAQPLSFYPNPVNDKLFLKDISGGNYSIFNTAGQLMQSGKLQNGNVVPVQSLAQGLYRLIVNTSNGKSLQTSFVRQ